MSLNQTSASIFREAAAGRQVSLDNFARAAEQSHIAIVTRHGRVAFKYDGFTASTSIDTKNVGGDGSDFKTLAQRRLEHG